MTEGKKGGTCWHCGNTLGALDYGREDVCPKCGWNTKVCRNCEFYERGAHNDCRESQAERVVDKERSNFCDYFRPRGGPGGNAPGRDALKSAAEALFGKK
jgi:hypothetical protein